MPTSRGSVAQDLAVAEQDFADADQALKDGDLGTYQTDIRAGEAAVALAYKQEQTTTTTTKKALGKARATKARPARKKS